MFVCLLWLHFFIIVTLVTKVTNDPTAVITFVIMFILGTMITRVQEVPMVTFVTIFTLITKIRCVSMVSMLTFGYQGYPWSCCCYGNANRHRFWALRTSYNVLMLLTGKPLECVLRMNAKIFCGVVCVWLSNRMSVQTIAMRCLIFPLVEHPITYRPILHARFDTLTVSLLENLFLCSVT